MSWRSGPRLGELLGLEARAVIVATAMLLVSVMGTTTYGFIEARRLLEESASGRLQSLHRALALSCGFSMLVGDRDQIARTLGEFMSLEPIAYCVVEDPGGQRLAVASTPRFAADTSASAAPGATDRFDIIESVEEVRLPDATSPETQLLGDSPRHSSGTVSGRIRLAISVRDYQDRMLQLRRNLMGAGLGLFAAVLLLTGIMMRRVTRPLREMADLAERVASGDLDAHLPGAAAGELGLLASSLNRMVRSLADSRDEVARSHATLEARVRERTLELTLAHEYIERVLGQVPLPLVVTDGSLAVMYTNPTFDEMLGAPVGRLLDGIRGTLHPPVEEIRSWLTAQGEKGGELPLGVVWLRDGGESITLEVRAASFRQGDTKVIVCALQDVTLQRRLQEEISHGARLAAVGELAAGVAHEINNPLDGVFGMSRLLRKPLASDEKAMGRLEMLEACARRIAVITRNLLLFSRQEQAMFTEQDVRTGLELALSLVGATLKLKGGIDLQCRIPDRLPKIRAKGNQLEQVWINLVNNAGQALAELPSERQRRLEIDVHELRGEERIEVVVKDNGPGIPEDVVNRIFEPFFTTKGRHAGTGLGLAISYGIVQDHGGDIQVESKEGEGSVFTVSLPVASREAA